MKYLDANGLAHLWEKLKAYFVRQESGKGLSSNDYTDADRDKLASLEPGLDGKDGVTYTPSLADDGTLSWTNDGERENPQPVNIMGPAGPQGAPGKDGAPGSNGTNGSPGTPGSAWYSGTALTSTSTSTNTSSSSLTDYYRVGDYYLNTNYGYVYRCVTAGTGSAAAWRYQGSIRGATGSSGTSAHWYTGTALTGTGTGISGSSSVNGGSYCYVGDMYLNTSTSYVYRCTTSGSGTSSRWAYQCSIMGATGSPGTPGANGTNGTNGKDGAKGDTGDCFVPSVDALGNLSWTKKTGSSTTTTPATVNIKGPKGDDGSNGKDGAKGDTGNYFQPSVTSSGLLSWSLKSGSTSATTPSSVNIMGPTGPQGPAGVISYKSGETATGGTWINGKPIYRYVTTLGSVKAGSETSVSLSTTIGTLIFFYGAATSTTGAQFTLPYVSKQSTGVVGLHITGGNKLTIVAGSGQGFTSGYLIILYTK